MSRAGLSLGLAGGLILAFALAVAFGEAGLTADQYRHAFSD